MHLGCRVDADRPFKVSDIERFVLFLATLEHSHSTTLSLSLSLFLLRHIPPLLLLAQSAPHLHQLPISWLQDVDVPKVNSDREVESLREE